MKLSEGTSCRLNRRRIEQQQLRHSRTFSSARAGICLASTSIWHDQRINPARIFPSARSSSGWRLPGMRFYRFVDPCPSRRRSCICMSTSTLPAYKASIEKHTDWTGRPSFSNATLPRPGTPSSNFRELRNNKASYSTCVPLMFSFACCFYINISRGHLGNRISLRPHHFAFNAAFWSSGSLRSDYITRDNSFAQSFQRFYAVWYKKSKPVKWFYLLVDNEKNNFIKYFSLNRNKKNLEIVWNIRGSMK